MNKKLIALAAVIAAGLAQQASAKNLYVSATPNSGSFGLNVFVSADPESDFLSQAFTDIDLNNFTGLSGSTQSLIPHTGPGSSSTFKYTITSTTGLFSGAGVHGVNPDYPAGNAQAVATVSEFDHLVVNFLSGNVSAVGGNMFLTNPDGTSFVASGGAVGGLQLSLSDGTSINFDSTNLRSSFVGYTADSGSYITKMELYYVGGDPWPTLDHFYVGTVAQAPDAGASSLLLGLGLLGLGCFRRIRN